MVGAAPGGVAPGAFIRGGVHRTEAAPDILSAPAVEAVQGEGDVVRGLPAALVNVAPPPVLLEPVPGLDQEKALVARDRGWPAPILLAGRGRNQKEALLGVSLGCFRPPRNQGD